MTPALQLGSLVAEGRLATVHRAERGGRTVAVKRARADVPGAAAALRREARVLSAVRHPAIVPVLDLLDDGVEPALVLGWADGGSLGDLLADGPLPTADLLHLLRPLAAGLDALHAKGVAHLDVSIENVLLAAAGPVIVDPAPPGAGTPGYTDPVVAAGGPPSSRSDVYGLAACAHVALTGRLPRAAGGIAIGLVLPQPVREVLAAGLHPDPRCRPPSPPAFVERLAEALGGAPPSGSRGRPVARAAPPSAGPARTWPFDRWREEAEACAERQAAIARVVSGPIPAFRSSRRRARAAADAARMLRTSAPDSTRRPPATRPPPTTTPGGKP